MMHLRFASLALSLLASSASALAAAPALFSHHGYLTQSGTPVAGSVAIEFRLYDSDAGGAPLWAEPLSVDCEAGYYSVILGKTVALDTAALAAAPQLWLAMSIGGGAETSPRLEVTSVPFALVAARAATADMASDVSCTACVDAPEVAFGYAGSNSAGGAANDVGCTSACIDASELDNAAVTNAKLADGAVTTIKLGDNSVTPAKLADAAVTLPKLAPCGANQGLVMSGGVWTCAAPISRACPAGTVSLGPRCIDQTPRATALIANAIADCYDENSYVCTSQDLIVACQQRVALGITMADVTWYWNGTMGSKWWSSTYYYDVANVWQRSGANCIYQHSWSSGAVTSQAYFCCKEIAPMVR